MKTETTKIKGEPAYTKVSADNSTPKFNAGWPSWLTPLETQGISVTNCDGTLIRYRTNFSFIIVAFCRLLTGLTERITMELETPPVKETSPIETSHIKTPSIVSVLGILLMNTICVAIF